MSIRVSPTAVDPTHHFSLEDRSGRRLGLTVCDESGTARPLHDERIYIKQPVDTTANKQTSGGSSYQDYDYPYSPIVQNDLSGGRGSLNYESDSTKYWDSFRCQSGTPGKAYAGPLEQYATGLRTSVQTMPNNVRWIPGLGNHKIFYKKIVMSEGTWTAETLWLLLRKRGNPSPLTVEIRNNNAGAVGTLITSLTVANTAVPDLMSEWVIKDLNQSFGNNTYWLVITTASTDSQRNHWLLGCNSGSATTYSSLEYTSSPSARTFNLIYRLADAETEKTCIAFEYMEQQYFAISSLSGAPKIYMAGDRGAADSNSGALTKVKDATKSWTTNQWAGAVVMVINGPGWNEQQNWRVISSNTSNELTVNRAWKTTHTTSTEYVIISPILKEITGHGLTAPVTDVCVSPKGLVYFCMGDSVTVRRMREYNNSGTWTTQWADEAVATKAVFMVYKPMAGKFVVGKNSATVVINTSTNLPAWGTDLTWGSNLAIDSEYSKITGLAIYPDDQGSEAVYVFKTDMVFFVNSSNEVNPINLEEMRTVRSAKNGARPLKHNLFLYFPLLQGLERFYSGQIDDIGPNTGEGLPKNRKGSIVSMVGYPGRFYAAVNAGTNGYSSVLHSGGWHEIYRAPKGQKIGWLAFQVSPGASLDRMWVWQGNDLVWLPFPSNTTQELEDEEYLHSYEFSVTLSRMHASLYDVQKLIKKIKIYSDALAKSSTGALEQWIELDYRLNEDEKWETVTDVFDTSPTQEVDFSPIFGIAGKRLQLRIRGYTTNAKKTPVFQAIVISAVIRTDIKSFYGPFQVRIMDDEPVGLRDTDSVYTAAQKLALLEMWADSDNDSMLRQYSASALCHDKLVFLNLGPRRHVRFAGTSNNENKSDVYVVTATMQEA